MGLSRFAGDRVSARLRISERILARSFSVATVSGWSVSNESACSLFEFVINYDAIKHRKDDETDPVIDPSPISRSTLMNPRIEIAGLTL
jgi:hypothetical protein